MGAADGEHEESTLIGQQFCRGRSHTSSYKYSSHIEGMTTCSGVVAVEGVKLGSLQVVTTFTRLYRELQ